MVVVRQHWCLFCLPWGTDVGGLQFPDPLEGLPLCQHPALPCGVGGWHQEQKSAGLAVVLAWDVRAWHRWEGEAAALGKAGSSRSLVGVSALG